MRLPAFLVVILALFTHPAFAELKCDINEASAQVMEQRERFNDAIIQSDIDTIAAILNENVTLVTGTDSELFNGKQAQLAIWQSDFDSPEPPTIYIRTPHCVVVSKLGNMAMEYGDWKGKLNGNTLFSGSYNAKWRYSALDQQWMLDAEIYMTSYLK
ncbi:DUF4440 domain-containing protein [Glaciecola sp. XM2]|uniref:YybH family protein n=1 Tax=Glaciecola sp. XM2 TaxID=1914931 RepID=UPI001BDE56E4|nr:nuclear transport factor 2 family protein [Glaciecola sp. XM2]MBT1451351.1 DUF4440 domain-containing protein [Glaciecola sp. XM2]